MGVTGDVNDTPKEPSAPPSAPPSDLHPEDEQDNLPASEPEVEEETDEEASSPKIQTCRVCGCTDDDCSQCIEKTGAPCHWVEDDLCSACAPIPELEIEPLPEVPEPEKFAKLCRAASELTVSKVSSQLGRLIQAGILSDKNNWATTQEHRHGIPQIVVELCKDPETIVNYWPLVRFLRGRSLGHPAAEIRIVVSWAILGTITMLCHADLLEATPFSDPPRETTEPHVPAPE
jgi:hypothetical protein